LQTDGPHFVFLPHRAEARFDLSNGNCWTIGRADTNTFVFDDPWMSKRHAVVIQIEPGKFCLIDLGSANGSRLNGRQITKLAELRHGDSVLLGETILEFRNPGVRNPELPKPVTANEPAAISGPLTDCYNRRLITVLVVDIRDFTELTRQIEESVLARTMSAWCREIGLIFRRSGCAMEKYIGDAAMAVWIHEGQIPSEGQMLQLLSTLLEIQQFTTNLQQQFSLPSPLRIGAGINIGLGIMGNRGTEESPDFSPLGDSVNAAFRLESCTKNSGFDVAMGRLSFECLSGASNIGKHFEKRLLELKGYEERAEVWLTSYGKLRDFLGGLHKRQ
jgi:adenylate cyclase